MEEFMGSWVLEKSENFEEYLTARNVPWLIKKAMAMAKVTKTFKHNESDGTYTLINEYPIKNMTVTFKFKDVIEQTGLDNKKHTISYDFKDGVLYETHVHLEEEDKTPETYRYVREGDYIVVNLDHNGVTAKRFYKKKSS